MVNRRTWPRAVALAMNRHCRLPRKADGPHALMPLQSINGTGMARVWLEFQEENPI